MAANEYTLSAGLPVAKDSGQSPTSQVNTYYLSAGLLPEILSAAAGISIPVVMYHRKQMGVS